MKWPAIYTADRYAMIVEGVDGVGKSSLCKALQLPTFHADQHTSLEDYVEFIYSYDGITDPSGICFDRSPISEYVYGRVLRGKSTAQAALDLKHDLAYLEVACKNTDRHLMACIVKPAYGTMRDELYAHYAWLTAQRAELVPSKELYSEVAAVYDEVYRYLNHQTIYVNLATLRKE